MRCVSPAPVVILSVALAAASTACTHPESAADAVVRLPEPAATSAAPAPAARTWVEAVRQESHAAADIDVATYRVHLPSAAACATITTHLHDWAMANVTSITRDAEDAASEEDVATPERPRFWLRISCEPKVVSESLVSIRCMVASYQGGAHESLVAESFNFAVDGDVARPIGLDDLFLDPKVGRAALGDTCLAELRAQEALWVTAGNVTDLHEMVDTFHLERGKVVVTFAPYEVGPFAEGEHVVEVPMSALRGLRPVWASRLRDLP